MTKDGFDHLMEGASDKIGADTVNDRLNAHARTLAWPLPADWRAIVARDVASLVQRVSESVAI